jgi:uncharacterized caspase-like protein
MSPLQYKRVITALILNSLLIIFTNPVYPQAANLNQRVALVIGNADYKLGPLLNPVNDARAISDALRAANFDVIKYENIATMADMKKAVREFGLKIQNGGVGLFYYAGHGMQVNGSNYLIPVQAEIYKEEEVEFESLDVNFVLAQMEGAHNRMNIIILDACRDNPFSRSWRSASSAKGLAFINAPAGTLIAYATAPGSVASDGTGNNGLYTEEILKQINKSGMKIEDVFKNVRVGVIERSNKLQTPWESSSLVGDFYFVEKPASESPSETTAELAENYTENYNFFEGYSGSDSRTSDNLPSIRWRASNNRYWLILKERDISAQTVNSTCGDHLLVYFNENGRYYLLKDFWKNQDNAFREAVELPFAGSACWMAKDNKYWFYDKGVDITSQTKNAFYDEHLVIYNMTNRQYYFCPLFKQFMNGYVYPADPVYSTNGTLWRGDSKYYFLYVEGEQIGARTFCQWNGNDLIVYDETGGSSYLLPDFYNSRDNTLRQAEIVISPGMITWKRQDNTYFLYRNGVQFAGAETTVADASGTDLLVFEKTYQQTYLLTGWEFSNDFIERYPVILFSPTGVFWKRSGNTFWIYRYGQIIDYELSQTWNGNDMEVYDSLLGLTYVLPGYAFSDDNILRAAMVKNN